MQMFTFFPSLQAPYSLPGLWRSISLAQKPGLPFERTSSTHVASWGVIHGAVSEEVILRELHENPYKLGRWWLKPPCCDIPFFCSLLCVCSVTQMCLTLCDPHGLWPARLLCPWNFSGKNTGVSCHFLLQGIFLTWGLNLCLLPLLHLKEYSLPLHHLGSPW